MSLNSLKVWPLTNELPAGMAISQESLLQRDGDLIKHRLMAEAACGITWALLENQLPGNLLSLSLLQYHSGGRK